jgi:PASTA domain
MVCVGPVDLPSMKKILVVAVALVVFCMTASPAFGQATRTWVSSNGNDLDPCSVTAPCRTFAGAIGKTFIGGEINALTDGGFGTVTITKSITIDGAAHHSSILSSGTTGVSIRIPENANDPHRRVVLRNLSINGTGASGTVGTNTGLFGVNVNNEGAETVELENVRIANFSQGGIRVAPTAVSPAQMTLSLDNVFVSDLTGNALELRPPDASHSMNALVRNSTFKHSRERSGIPAGESGIGIAADTGAHVWLTGTSVFDNAIGLRTLARQGAPGVIDSFCDNQIGGNVDNGTVPNDLCPKLAPTPSVVLTETLTETVTQTAPPQCVVPALRGLQVPFARRLLKAAGCALGRVAKKPAKKRKQVGKVMSQKVKAGRTVGIGTKVGVTVGRR